MGGHRDSHTEQRKIEKEKYHTTDFLYMQNLKRNDTNEQMNLFTEQKQTHRLREKTYGCQIGKDTIFPSTLWVLFLVLPTTLRNIIYTFFGVFESPQKSW